MTTTKIQVVNQDLDDHFTEQYGKETFLSTYELDKSNWQKMVAGERKMPKVFKLLMMREKEIMRLNDVINLVSKNIDTQALIEHLEAKDAQEISELRSENDRLKSCLRMVVSQQQHSYKATQKLIEKLK